MDENKLQELQMLEQNLHSLLYQKQVFQMELSETEAALKEIDNSGDEVYKIVGQLMLKTDKKKVKEELEKKKKIFDMRIKSFDKQEKTMSEKLINLRKEIIKEPKK